MLEISRSLFDAWNNADIVYCHWKSNEHLYPGLVGDTDLDVLLSNSNGKRGKQIMRDLDFLECKSQYGSTYPEVEDWIGFDQETGKMIHVHLHFRLATGHKGSKEYSLPWVDLALSTRVLDKKYNVYIMEPNLEMVTLYTRIGLKVSISTIIKGLLGKYKEDKNSWVEIQWLKERVDWTKVETLINDYYKDAAESILKIMKHEHIDYDSLLKLRSLSEKCFSNCNRVGWRNRFIEFYYDNVYRRLSKVIKKANPFFIKKKTPKNGNGLTITFLGQDGAGKTTVTNDLLKWLGWKLDVKYVYLGSGDNYFSWRKSILKYIPHGGPFKIIRAWLRFTIITNLAKDVNKNIERGEQYASKGGICVYDRYPQDKYPGINDGPKLRSNFIPRLPSQIQRMLLRYADVEEKLISKASKHQPNLVFKLILPPEESIRRKPKENIEIVRRKHEIIKSLDFPGSDIYTIDATMNYQEEIVMIKNIIWQHIQK